MDQNSIVDRLKEFIQHIGLNDSQFADACGISRPTLSFILSGKNKKINDIQLSQVHKAFPQLSINWLLFEEGKMLTEKEENKDSDSVVPEYPKENGLKDNLETIELITKESLSEIIKDSLKLDEKLKENKKPKKIVQITVYYDDSSFENFFHS